MFHKNVSCISYETFAVNMQIGVAVSNNVAFTLKQISRVENGVEVASGEQEKLGLILYIIYFDIKNLYVSR